MTGSEAETYVEAAAATLGLTIAPEWRAGVVTFFEIAKGMAVLVACDGGPNECENAPVFVVKDAE